MPRTVKKTKNLAIGKPEKPIGLGQQAFAKWDQLVAELDASCLQAVP